VFNRSAARLRPALLSAAVVGLLVLTAAPVSASTQPPPDKSFSENGSHADVLVGDCLPNGDGTTTCTDEGLSVFAGKMTDSFSGVVHSSQVCVRLSTQTFDDATGEPVGEPRYEQGCVLDVPHGALAFGANMTSVSLAPTTVEIQEQVCDKEGCVPGASRNVTVAASWTGVGSIMSWKYRTRLDQDLCRYDESAKGSARNATYTGTLDGVELLAYAYPSMNQGRLSFSSRCSEG
jgi:hypothetical protein